MKKHLLMHVWPREGRAWRLTLRQVLARIEQFDGRRVFAVAVGHDTEPAQAVRDMLPGDAELLEFANDPALREVVSFVPLLERVEREPGLTFYCHGKGSTHDEGSICQEWGRAMCETLLDYPDVIERALRTRPIAGSFRRGGRFGLNPNNWHYSGTFFWLNNALTFQSERTWRGVDRAWFGTEAWPGKHWSREQGACVFLDDCADLYQEGYWVNVVRPALRLWRQGPTITVEDGPSDGCRFVSLRRGYSRCTKCGRVVHDVRLLRRYVCGQRAAPAPDGCPTAEDQLCVVRGVEVVACSEHGACSRTEIPGVDVHACPRLIPGRPFDGACRHRGDRLFGTACEQCGPGKTAPVFACALYGTCVAHPLRHVEIRACSECKDRDLFTLQT
jgi:hypothetical protein